jgi:Flp pilus assembly pilin Flp
VGLSQVLDALARSFLRRTRPLPARDLGQGLVEYGLILGLSAIVAILILTLLGDQVADLVQWLGRTIDAAPGVG